MTSQPKPDFLDTVQIVTDSQTASPNASADFAETVQVEDDAEIWAESPDFQSSESASLFAGTQPGKLDIV